MVSWWELAMNGRGAWAREARKALGLASTRRVVLDPEYLIYCDVRDLQAISLRLTQGRKPFPRH